MSISHDGFTFTCELAVVLPKADIDAWHKPYHSSAKTERTAIEHARDVGWAIVHVRVTKGAPKSLVRTVRRVFCPGCRWMVGL